MLRILEGNSFSFTAVKSKPPVVSNGSCKLFPWWWSGWNMKSNSSYLVPMCGMWDKFACALCTPEIRLAVVLIGRHPVPELSVLYISQSSGPRNLRNFRILDEITLETTRAFFSNFLEDNGWLHVVRLQWWKQHTQAAPLLVQLCGSFIHSVCMKNLR
jgi:hypothetical protein